MSSECAVCFKAETIGEHEADIENLKRWQKSQNGSLIRLADSIEKLNNRLNALQWWLIGLLASTLTGVILILLKL